MANIIYKVVFPASAQGVIFEESGGGGNAVSINAPASISSDYSLTLPVDDGGTNQVLATDGSGVLSWINGPEADSNITVINSGTVEVNNTVDELIGNFTWDSSTYTSVSSIECIFWYSNMSGGTADLTISSDDGTNTANTTISSGSADGIGSFSVPIPGSDVKIKVFVRSSDGSLPDPNISGVGFRLT